MKGAIDIFSGAGGMSAGAELAGIKIQFAVENNKDAAETFRGNHPGAEVVCNDIKKVSVPEKFKDTFVLFGGPPCQGFSISNTKTRNLKNENNSLFKEFVRFVREARPKWFVFENVEGFVSFQEGDILRKLKRKLEKLGYKISYSVLTASDYGVPQNRNRFFMVGNILDIDFVFPKKEKRRVTVKQAINDLPALKNGDNYDQLPYKRGRKSEYAKQMRKGCNVATQNYVSRNKDYVIERYKHIPKGKNWKAIPKDLMANYKDLTKCHSGIYKRLDDNKPSVVIANYRKNMLIHPYQDRGLSVREAARLQSFPDSFKFEGSLMHIQQQIGNAVPPLLAKAIFEQIVHLTNKRNGQQKPR
ncbi:DNA cytosine methyltransferase [Flagellimonas oceanensis]|uniref:DNA cytosine methyltransferase n=1 Tax=Flagellimonas oceanensis TaxID=2499163 RepID=UPI000F8D6EB5|nr:DNA cytosine methyltransferase [Allomuricauda oceanensis]